MELLDIPGLKPAEQVQCQVKAMCIDGKSPALAALAEWEATQKADYKKIMKVLRMLGQLKRIRDEDKVKKCSNNQYPDVYEARADKGHARLMFFYDEDDQSIVICTNDYWKGSGSQDTAFKHCHDFKKYYSSWKKKKISV